MRRAVPKCNASSINVTQRTKRAANSHPSPAPGRASFGMAGGIGRGAAPKPLPFGPVRKYQNATLKPAEIRHYLPIRVFRAGFGAPPSAATISRDTDGMVCGRFWSAHRTAASWATASSSSLTHWCRRQPSEWRRDVSIPHLDRQRTPPCHPGSRVTRTRRSAVRAAIPANPPPRPHTPGQPYVDQATPVSHAAMPPPPNLPIM